MNTPISGPYAAIVTPFNPDGSLNENGLRAQVERQIGFGNNIFCNGTNGEFFVLTDEEKRRVTAVCIEQAKGRVSVVSHIGELTLEQTIAHGKDVQPLGLDAVSVITPWFSALRETELINYYRQVADSLDIPVYLYNIPARTGNTITPAIADALASHPNIYGIKDSAGSYESLSGFLEVARKHNQFDVLTGPDSLILTGFQEGCIGCVSGIANIVPGLVNQIYTGFKNDDLQSANQAQERINHLRDNLYPIAFAPAVVKKTISLLGEDVGESRYPVCFTDDDVNKIKTIIHNQ